MFKPCINIGDELRRRSAYTISHIYRIQITQLADNISCQAAFDDQVVDNP